MFAGFVETLLVCFTPYAENPLRIEFFGDEVESISERLATLQEKCWEFDAIPVAGSTSHYVTSQVTHALSTISERDGAQC